PVNQPALNYLNNWYAGAPTGGLQNFMAPQQGVSSPPLSGVSGPNALSSFSPSSGGGGLPIRPVGGVGFGAGAPSATGGFGAPVFGQLGGQFGGASSGAGVGRFGGPVGGSFGTSLGSPVGGASFNGFGSIGAQRGPLGPYGFGAPSSMRGSGGAVSGFASGAGPYGGAQGMGAASPGGASFAMRVPFAPGIGTINGPGIGPSIGPNNGPQMRPGQLVPNPQPGQMPVDGGAATFAW
ncbi:MAG TPA: hypothetical protein VIF60_16980, partial [Burkholderiaceae bacterium]